MMWTTRSCPVSLRSSGRLGNRQAGRRLAGGRGLRLSLTDQRGLSYEVTVHLRLGGFDRAQPLHATEVATTPSGEGHGTQADLHHEYIGVRTIGTTNTRGISIPVDGATFGAPDGGVLTNITAGMGVAASASTSYAQIDVQVLTAMRQIMYEGTSAYFQLPDNTWHIEIEPRQQKTPAIASQRLASDASAGNVVVPSDPSRLSA